MKRILFFAFILTTLLFNSCEEIPPVVNPIMGPIDDTTSVNFEDQQRQVLIEEFTGVRCVQCPAGSAELEALLAIHGKQLVAVSIHAGDFAPPFPESLYDFRTSEGEQILNYLGQPFGYPSAVVNRKLFEDEFDLQLGKNQWAGFIEQEKANPPKVKIGLETAFNPGDNTLDIDVTILVEETITDPDIHLSVMLTENGIVDYQETPDQGKISNYTHKHVLRDMPTSYDGEALGSPLVAGSTIEQSYSMQLNENWIVDKMSVIAFVHLVGNVREVLQATEVKLND